MGIQLQDIVELVAKRYGIEPSQILGTRKQHGGWGAHTRARQAIMYLAREHTPMSLPQIARGLGAKTFDHTTVLHNVRVVAERLREARMLEELSAEITALHVDRPLPNRTAVE